MRTGGDQCYKLSGGGARRRPIAGRQPSW